VLLLTFIMMLVASSLALAVAVAAQNSQSVARSQLQDKQAWYVAEAGWQRARQQLAAGAWSAGTCSSAAPCCEWMPSLADCGAAASGQTGQYQVAIDDNGDGTYTITAGGYVPLAGVYVARREIVETELDVSMTDGTNKSLAATASASSSNGANVPSRARDGDTATRWQCGTSGSGCWLRMDYGSATTVNKVIIREQNDNINALTIETSSDGASWAVVDDLSVAEGSGNVWTATFAATSRRYLRARFTDVDGGAAVRVREMESYDSAVSSVGQGEVTTRW
jgi:hypothetical protein